jgi:serine phosphatase RsbU (regulator of sigma subunit)/anti-sigma regulatory factor (Ser/Thr protein kinase)
LPLKGAELKAGKIIKFTIPARTEYLTKVRDFAVKYGEKYGFNLRQINGFKLSLDEICTNIIQYAYNTPGISGNIHIEMMRNNDTITAKIFDSGVGFEFSSVSNPDLIRYVNDKKRGGFGIYIVRQLNEEVRYERVGKTNVLTLTNHVEPRPSLFELIKKNFKPSHMTIKVRFGLIATLIISVISVGTFYLASLSQKKTLSEQYIQNHVLLLKNFSATSADYILSERDLLLTEQVFELLESREDVSRLTIIDRNARIIADKTLQNIGKLYSPPAGIVPLIDQEYLVQEHLDPDFGTSLYLSAPIKIEGKIIGKAFLSIRKEAVYKMVALRQNRIKILIYMILFWSIGIIGITFMVNMFVTPIKKIAEELNRVSKEGTSGGFHFSGVGEFAEITTAFNRMMKEIRLSQAKLTDQARLKREMQLAQSIQHTLLPKRVPETEGFEIAAEYNAAMEVGGDYYDFFYLDDKSVGMAVGDVSGKGIGGAFLMSIVRTALRLEARGEKSASDVLVKINNTLQSEFKKGMYMTLFYIILDSKKREINYASAGHTPMILYRGKTERMYRMNPKGFPIGLNIGDPKLFKRNMGNEKISLDKGDLLLIYTDGITEAMNPEREEFGEIRLIDFIKKHYPQQPKEFAVKLIEEVHHFTHGSPQADDITFIVIKEKKKKGEITFEKRVKLFDLIESQGCTIKEACKKVGISRTTYYKLKYLREEKGTDALIPKLENKKINVVDFDISQKILEVIRDYPEYSAKKIQEALATDTYGFLTIDYTLIYRELKRLKLSTRKKRVSYIKRIRDNGHI